MKKLPARELSRNKSILRFDVLRQSLQHYWPIEQYLRHIRDFFGGKTKSPCFDLFIHWLIKQVTNTYRNHFSRSYESRSNASGFQKNALQACRTGSPQSHSAIVLTFTPYLTFRATTLPALRFLPEVSGFWHFLVSALFFLGTVVE